MWMGQQGGRKEAGTEIDGHLQEAVRAAANVLRRPFIGGGELDDLIAALVKV
jgi:hypothetical protein